MNNDATARRKTCLGLLPLALLWAACSAQDPIAPEDDEPLPTTPSSYSGPGETEITQLAAFFDPSRDPVLQEDPDGWVAEIVDPTAGILRLEFRRLADPGETVPQNTDESSTRHLMDAWEEATAGFLLGSTAEYRGPRLLQAVDLSAFFNAQNDPTLTPLAAGFQAEIDTPGFGHRLLSMETMDQVIEVFPGDDLFAMLANVGPGTQAIVHDGTYTTSREAVFRWNGTAEAPVTIRGALGERPIIRGSSSHGIMNISGSYFTFSGFEITHGLHTVRLRFVNDATLRDLRIHDAGSGIKCNFPDSDCDRLLITENEIWNTGLFDGNGEGMYLGCESSCRTTNSIITDNYLYDLGGHQGDGIELKAGCFGNIVSDNVIINSNYPGITVFGFDDPAGTPNIIERNLIWGTNDNGIQMVGQVVVRNNVILNAIGDGIHCRTNGSGAGDLTVVHNTVYGSGRYGFRAREWDLYDNQLVANNAFYSPGGTAVSISGSTPNAVFSSNVTLGEVPAGVLGFTPGRSVLEDLGDPATGLISPPAGSFLVDAGDPAFGEPEDYAGNDRMDGAPDVGAHEIGAPAAKVWRMAKGRLGH